MLFSIYGKEKRANWLTTCPLLPIIAAGWLMFFPVYGRSLLSLINSLGLPCCIKTVPCLKVALLWSSLNMVNPKPSMGLMHGYLQERGILQKMQFSKAELMNALNLDMDGMGHRKAKHQHCFWEHSKYCFFVQVPIYFCGIYTMIIYICICI